MTHEARPPQRKSQTQAWPLAEARQDPTQRVRPLDLAAGHDLRSMPMVVTSHSCPCASVDVRGRDLMPTLVISPSLADADVGAHILAQGADQGTSSSSPAAEACFQFSGELESINAE